MNQIEFVIVGLGGYALVHLDAINWLEEQNLARLTGIVALKQDQEKYPDLVSSLRNRNVTIYSELAEFFASNHKADVLTVPIGIHMHIPVSIAALAAGMNVYCEKPLAATVQEVDALIAAEKKYGKKIAVGFQHIYSFTMQELKVRICDGRLGPVKEISMMCGWPRSKQYYSRNDWTGQMKKGEHWILDSPANNAHAHYLLNMLYLCGPEQSAAATPRKVRAELYRANKINSPDTVQIAFETAGGAAGNAIFSHCNLRENGPHMRLKCENGNVEWQGDIGKTVITYNDGTQEEFDNLIHDKWRLEGFKDLVESINQDTLPKCMPEMARCHTVSINAIHESCPNIVQIPDSEIKEVEDWEMFPPDTKGSFRRVKNMDEYLQEAFARKKFLSDLNIPWAKHSQSQTFEIRNYNFFPKDKLK